MSVPLKGSAGFISKRVSIRRARWALRNSMIVRRRSRQLMCSRTGSCPSLSNRRFRSVASYPVGARKTVAPLSSRSMNSSWQWRISITRARKPKIPSPMGSVSGFTKPSSRNSIGWRSGKNLCLAGGVASGFGCVARFLQSRTTRPRALVLWEDTHADVCGQCAFSQGEDARGLTCTGLPVCPMMSWLIQCMKRST